MVIFAHYIPNNTGLIALQSVSDNLEKFRIAGTGIIMGFSTNYKIKKKLKLIG